MRTSAVESLTSHSSTPSPLRPLDPTCHSHQCDPPIPGHQRRRRQPVVPARWLFFALASRAPRCCSVFALGAAAAVAAPETEQAADDCCSWLAAGKTAASFLPARVREKRGKEIEEKRSSLRHASIALTHPTYPYLSSAAPPNPPPLCHHPPTAGLRR